MNSPSVSFENCMALTRQRGLTIIELMVVIAIAAVLMTIAVPSFEESSTKSEIRKGVNNLLSDLAFARSVAITRSQSVSLCASDTAGAQTCGTGDWNEGWLAFIDSNEDGALNNGEEIVRIGSAIGNRVAITLDNQVTFDSKGMNQAVSQFVICKANDSSASYSRAVLVNLGGLVRGSRDTNGDGIHNGGEGGGNLSCTS
ncbi:type IV fimbrial biogenesis protein FimT [Alteromonadaceae bacterium 2753L.S.0a.02]|nr:type IV fimbrial biogenesis protein FimT [Alteromonadaceae bacterium 2753L.S.0a.02]